MENQLIRDLLAYSIIPERSTIGQPSCCGHQHTWALGCPYCHCQEDPSRWNKRDMKSTHPPTGVETRNVDGIGKQPILHPTFE